MSEATKKAHRKVQTLRRHDRQKKHERENELRAKRKKGREQWTGQGV